MAFKYGQALYPLDPVDDQTLLRLCDPALFKLADYLRFVITKYADAAVQAVVQLPPQTSIKHVIEQVVPVDPDTIAKVDQFQFPLLCIWPKSAKYGERTLNWTLDTRTLGLAYVMPPLTGHQAVRWAPLLTAVSHICNAAMKAGHDVDYNDDERVLVSNRITSARLVSAEFGHFDFAGKGQPPFFPAWVAELEVAEKVEPYSAGLSDFDGADVVADNHPVDLYETAVAANAAVADTALQVLDTANFLVGDLVVIGAGTAREEEVSVAAIPDATHLTLSAPGLAFAHTAAQADKVRQISPPVVRVATDVG